MAGFATAAGAALLLMSLSMCGTLQPAGAAWKPKYASQPVEAQVKETRLFSDRGGI